MKEAEMHIAEVAVEKTEHCFVKESNKEKGRHVTGRGCQGYVTIQDQNKSKENEQEWKNRRESVMEYKIEGNKSIDEDKTTESKEKEHKNETGSVQQTTKENKTKETKDKQELAEFMYRNKNNEIVNQKEQIISSMRALIQLNGQGNEVVKGDLIEWDGGSIVPIVVTDAWAEDDHVTVAIDKKAEKEMGKWAVKERKVSNAEIKTIWRSPYKVPVKQKRNHGRSSKEIGSEYNATTMIWLKNVEKLCKEEKERNTEGIRIKNLETCRTWLIRVAKIQREREREATEESEEAIKQGKESTTNIEETEQDNDEEKRKIEADAAQEYRQRSGSEAHK